MSENLYIVPTKSNLHHLTFKNTFRIKNYGIRQLEKKSFSIPTFEESCVKYFPYFEKVPKQYMHINAKVSTENKKVWSIEPEGNSPSMQN